MTFWRKRSSPIDRAVEELDQQITSIQKQLRQESVERATAANPLLGGASSAGSPTSRVEAVFKTIKEMLTPPEKRRLAAPARVRRDLFDVPSEPLKDLEAEPIAFTRRPDPDLFAPTEKEMVVSSAARARGQIDCATKPEQRLLHYLSAGSIRSYKPLKHVQRQTRNRFFMWLGLSLIALWVLYAVIR